MLVLMQKKAKRSYGRSAGGLAGSEERKIRWFSQKDAMTKWRCCWYRKSGMKEAPSRLTGSTAHLSGLREASEGGAGTCKHLLCALEESDANLHGSLKGSAGASRWSVSQKKKTVLVQLPGKRGKDS